MFSNCSQKFFVIAVAVIVAAMSVHQAEAAAPWFLIFHGKPLQDRIVLKIWHENQRLSLAVAEAINVSDRYLQDRPYIEMAYFWGPEWLSYPSDEASVKKLEPENGNQHGRFYPAYGAAEAVITFDKASGPLQRKITKDGLEILLKYGIPTRIDKR
jgi:hypothetical protein